MSSMIKAKHYDDHETALSQDFRVMKLCYEYMKQSGIIPTSEDSISFHDTLAINAEARSRGIEFSHIGAVTGAFVKVVENVRGTIKMLSDDTGMDDNQKAVMAKMLKNVKK